MSTGNVSGLFNLNVDANRGVNRPSGLEGQAPSATTVATNIYDPNNKLDEQALVANSAFYHPTA